MVNANGVRKKGRFFWEKAGAPLRWARVDNFFFISYTLGAFYSIFEGGSTFLCDFFALGAFSRRVALFCKPWAF